MKRRVLRAVTANVALTASDEALVESPRYFRDVGWECLLNDYHELPDAPGAEPVDGELLVWDCEREDLDITVQGTVAIAAGPVARLEREAKDRRYALLGTQGFLYRFILAVLERTKGVYSFHSNSLYDPRTDTLVIAMGGAGAGKTPVLLSGIARGWRLFSTELTHFSVDGDRCVFYKGGLLDNVRVGNLSEDFPEVAGGLGLALPDVSDPWATKICVDLRSVAAEPDRLVNPNLRILFPRIEAGWPKPLLTRVSDRVALQKALYDNASEKVGSSFLLYERVPCAGFDTPALARERFRAMGVLLDVGRPERAENLLASPRACLELF